MSTWQDPESLKRQGSGHLCEELSTLGWWRQKDPPCMCLSPWAAPKGEAWLRAGISLCFQTAAAMRSLTSNSCHHASPALWWTVSPQTISQDTPFLPHLASCQIFSNSNEESHLYSMERCSLFFLRENLFWMKPMVILHLPGQSLNSLPASWVAFSIYSLKGFTSERDPTNVNSHVSRIIYFHFPFPLIIIGCQFSILVAYGYFMKYSWLCPLCIL